MLFIVGDYLYRGSMEGHPLARVRRSWRRKNIFIAIKL
jgi:hypothetical protein